MKGKYYTQTEMDKAVKEAYDKGRADGFESASEAYEYDGY